MKDRVWKFLKHKKKKLIVPMLFVVLSAGSLYAAGYSAASPDSEYVLFNDAVQSAEESKEKLEFAQKYNKKIPAPSDLVVALAIFRKVIDAPPVGSKVDAFAQYNIATYMLEHKEIFFQAGISETKFYLEVRAFLIDALRDYYDEDFVKQLEIVNEYAKQALQNEEGYSEEEAESILRNEGTLPDVEGGTTLVSGKLPGKGIFEWDY